MLVREPQIAIFAARSREQFELALRAHAASFAPELARIAGETNLATAVRTALDRAEFYGFSNRGPTRLFLELMLTFGSEFDTDPVLSWTRPWLDNRSTDQMVRAVNLHAAMQTYVVRVAGLDGSAALASLRRARSLRLEDFDAMGDVSNDDLLAMLRSTYPDRWELAGPAALECVIGHASRLTQSVALPAAAGTALLTGVLFGFGHGAADDPLYPWIGQTLRSRQIVEPRARLVRLHRKVNAYIDGVLAGAG